MQKKYELTPEHRTQLKPWADMWIANAMSTKAMDDNDRDKMRNAIIGQYAAAKLPPPKNIVFVSSPFVLRFAGGFAALIWEMRKRGIGIPTDDATDDATRDATDDATNDATNDATRDATDLSKWFVGVGNMFEVSDSFGLGSHGITASKNTWRMWRGNNQWSGWVSFLSFFRHVAKLPIDYSKWQHYESACVHGGPMIMHADFCMVSDRPEKLTVDSENRPHCDNGPFCKWRDGTALYAVHGVRVPAWIIERPQDITIQKIDSEQNAEIRRVMIGRFGQSRYIVEKKATVVHADDFGTLYAQPQENDEMMMMVKVVNSTPEPDGSFKDYFLRVHPELKPLPSRPMNSQEARDWFAKQKGQELTARNAVASTFGLRGEEYAPEVET